MRFACSRGYAGARQGWAPGDADGRADIGITLFSRHLKFDPLVPRWPDRDRFVQSNGHGSMLLYSLLHFAGYEAISMEQIKNFRVLGSHTPGHPNTSPITDRDHHGPLGQGSPTPSAWRLLSGC